MFALGLSLVYMELPYREGRYLLGVVPFLLYFAMQGLRGTDVARWSIQLRHVLLLALVARHGLAMANAADYWRTYPRPSPGRNPRRRGRCSRPWRPTVAQTSGSFSSALGP